MAETPQSSQWDVMNPVTYAPFGEYKTEEAQGFIDAIRKIRDFFWKLGILGADRVADWQAQVDKGRREIIELHKNLAGRKQVLMAKVEKQLERSEDSARRDAVSTNAMEYCKANNGPSIVMQAQRAIALHQYCLAFELIFWGRLATKISGAENDIQATLYSMLGLSDVLVQQKELEGAEVEIGLYVDLATRTEVQASKGKADRLVDEISVLKRTDARRFNELLAQNLVAPSKKPKVEEAYWPVRQGEVRPTSPLAQSLENITERSKKR